MSRRAAPRPAFSTQTRPTTASDSALTSFQASSPRGCRESGRSRPCHLFDEGSRAGLGRPVERSDHRRLDPDHVVAERLGRPIGLLVLGAVGTGTATTDASSRSSVVRTVTRISPSSIVTSPMPDSWTTLMISRSRSASLGASPAVSDSSRRPRPRRRQAAARPPHRRERGGAVPLRSRRAPSRPRGALREPQAALRQARRRPQ